MKVKNSVLIRFLKQLDTSLGGKKLPSTLNFAIDANTSSIEKIVDAYEKTRTKLVEKYGKHDENGQLLSENGVAIIQDTVSFTNEMSELGNMEVEVTIQTINRSECEKCDTEHYDALSPGDIKALSFMLTK